MRANWFMPVEYGLCIITQDTIIQYKTHRFTFEDSEDSEIIIQRFDSLQSDFNSIPNADYFKKIKNIVGENYHFNFYNVEPYKVDKTYTLPAFEKRWKIKLKTNRQKALNGALSTEYGKENILQVLYNFGAVLLINNESSYREEREEEDFQIGAAFDYYNPWTNEGGKN